MIASIVSAIVATSGDHHVSTLGDECFVASSTRFQLGIGSGVLAMLSLAVAVAVAARGRQTT